MHDERSSGWGVLALGAAFAVFVPVLYGVFFAGAIFGLFAAPAALSNTYVMAGAGVLGVSFALVSLGAAIMAVRSPKTRGLGVTSLVLLALAVGGSVGLATLCWLVFALFDPAG